MPKNNYIIPEEYLFNININGMHGRYLKIPTKKNNKLNILIVYGHHSSLERMYSLACSFSAYGNITIPDLPGFGGMDSLYQINKKPSLDIMAEYLATFIKLNYKNSKFVICGMSYGFLVVTKMLQIHPEIQKKIILLVDLVGFSCYKDFSFSNKRLRGLKLLSLIFSKMPIAYFAHYVLFSKPIIYIAYRTFSKTHPKMKDATKIEFKERVHFEQYLWECNDARTYFYTMNEMLKVNLTESKINLDLNHVVVKEDQYFNNKIVLKNLNNIFKVVHVYTADLPNHAPTIISDVKQAGAIIPKSLREKLSKL